MLVCSLLACGARAEISKEYQLKAAFLYNFAKFVEWPQQRFTSDNEPLVIGVFGKNPFGTELENIVRGRKINNHEIVVREINTIEEAKSAHILFFSAAEDKNSGKVLDALRGSGVLTVGETQNFASQAGMIQFLLDGDKLRFEINVDAAEQDGLKISAQLLKLASSVRKKK